MYKEYIASLIILQVLEMSWIVIPRLVRTRQEYSYCYRETFSVNFARYDAVLENQRRVVPANVIRN